MGSKPSVKLPSEWIERSKRYGSGMVNGYAHGDNPASLAVSSHGAQSNPWLQAHARMAECALCLHFGKDPARALNWSGRCDAGWDLIAHGVRWDVKATVNGHYLIWPINKRHIFATKCFDALAFVRGEPPFFVMVGFTVKSLFWHEHKIAGQGHCLDVGTWYMHESELWAL